MYPIGSSASSNSSWRLARNCGFAVKLGVATTGVPDFLMATKFFGCAVFFRISCRLSASVCRGSGFFERGCGEPESFEASSGFRFWLSEAEYVFVGAAGDLRTGAGALGAVSVTGAVGDGAELAAEGVALPPFDFAASCSDSWSRMSN